MKEETRRKMEHFLKSVERRAFRIAEIATGNTEEALDIVQDAMLSMVKRYSRKPKEEWKPLFYRILQNRIRDGYRRNAVRKRVMFVMTGRKDRDDDREEDSISSFADKAQKSPAEWAMIGDAQRALDEALKRLPIRQQQAFLLRAWEELSVAETARAMGCSQGSVKTHYSRAIHALRNMLGDYWP